MMRLAFLTLLSLALSQAPTSTATPTRSIPAIEVATPTRTATRTAEACRPETPDAGSSAPRRVSGKTSLDMESLEEASTPRASSPEVRRAEGILEQSGFILSRERDMGLGDMLWLGALGLVLRWIARRLRALGDRLPERGLLPRASTLALLTVRMLLMVVVLQLGAALVPSTLAPAFPWIIVAGAVALGWSTREILTDVIAAVVLAFERRVREGDFVRGQRFAGEIRSIGLRATLLIDARGESVSIPNHLLLAEPMTVDRGPWPRVELELATPPHLFAHDVTRVLSEAASTVAHAAPAPVEVLAAPGKTGTFLVRARVLETRFIEIFESAVRERVREELEALDRLSPRLTEQTSASHADVDREGPHPGKEKETL